MKSRAEKQSQKKVGSVERSSTRAAVARSTFSSRHVKKLTGSEHFLKLMPKNGTLLWREAHFKLKIHKTPQRRSTDVGRWHAYAARGTFQRRLWREPDVKVKTLKKRTVSNHFLKFRCRKMPRRCGTKHITKSKCTKHRMVGPLFGVQMSKYLFAVNQIVSLLLNQLVM